MATVYLCLLLLCCMTGYCLCTLSCNFDHGLCDWQQEFGDQFDWRRHRGPTPDATSGPRSDHTSHRGLYVYIRGEDAATAQSHAALVSPFLSVTRPFNMSFWYFMNGNGIGTLSVARQSVRGRQTKLWSRSGRQGNHWLQGKLTLPPGVYQIAIDATAALNFGSDLAVDDIQMSREPQGAVGVSRLPTTPSTTRTTTTTTTTTPIPPITPRPTVSLSCAFEKDFCAWQQSSADHFDWRRSKGPTQDRSSGPSSDHTTGHGYFAYIQGTDVEHPNELARLTTPYVEVFSPSNMSFWYHMNGADIGTLKVLRIGLDQTTTVLFSLSGRQGPNWHREVVTLHPGIFRIVIEASARQHYASDIAIDDIIGATLAVFPVTTTTITTTPTTTQAPLPLTCTFESGTCGWTQYNGDQMNWTRARGPTPDFVSGPSGDHTTSKGYFMFLDGRHAGKSDWKADLIGHYLDLKAASNLTFWYFMNGVNTGSLEVLKLTPGGAVTTIWRRNGRQGNHWLEGQVTLNPGKFRLIFSASALHYYGSDLAIDDIKLTICDSEVPSEANNTDVNPALLASCDW